MGDMDRAVREALFCHEMFEPGHHGNVRFGLDRLREPQATWAFTSEQIQAAMTRLLQEELVAIDNGFWYATKAGRIARERMWQKKGYRHPALTHAEANTKDVILALIRSGGEDAEDVVYPHLEDRLLEIYLPDLPDDARQTTLQELATDGLIRRSASPFEKEVMHNALTADGLRVYAQQVVPRLGLQPPATILAAMEREVLQFDALGLPSLIADNLRYRWEEAERCMGACAWLSANILFGSILEVVLPAWLARVSTRALATQAAPRDKRPLAKWTLSEYLNVATELQLIDSALMQYATGLRLTRNLVHPDKQMRERSRPDGDVTTILSMWFSRSWKRWRDRRREVFGVHGKPGRRCGNGTSFRSIIDVSWPQPAAVRSAKQVVARR